MPLINFLIELARVLFNDPHQTHPADLPVNQDPIPSVIKPVPEKTIKLDDFCRAIRDYEGKAGDRNYRNNNPGNCRYSSVGYLPVYGHVGKDAQNFAVFGTYALGWLYLQNLVKYKINTNPGQTIIDFFKVYAPSSDGNDPVRYAAYVAGQCGAAPSLQMKYVVWTS